MIQACQSPGQDNFSEVQGKTYKMFVSLYELKNCLTEILLPPFPFNWQIISSLWPKKSTLWWEKSSYFPFQCLYLAGVDPRPPSTQSTTTQSTVSRNQPTQQTGNVERAGYTIEHRDVITMMSTVSGGVAFRQQMIPMFAEELRDSANNGDIYEIFLKTHEKLRNKLKGTAGEDQIPEYRSTLTKKLSLRNIFAHS